MQHDCITFFEYADRYLECANISFSTSKSYRSIINLIAQNLPADLPIQDLTAYHIKVLRKRLSAKLAPKTVNNRLALCSAIFKAAVSDKIIEENPASGLRLTVTNDDITPFTPPEMKAIIYKAYEMRPDIAVYFAIGFYAGLRSGEILALTRDDIDLERHTLRVSKTVTEGVLKRSTKTNNARYIDIIPALDPYLVEHLQYMGRRSMTDELLVSRTNLPIRSYKTISRLWRRILLMLNIRHRAQYQMRHTFACNTLSAGEDPAWISFMLGHRSLKMTLDVYGRWIIRRNERAGERFGEYMKGAE
jgi:integrase